MLLQGLHRAEAGSWAVPRGAVSHVSVHEPQIQSEGHRLKRASAPSHISASFVSASSGV